MRYVQGNDIYLNIFRMLIGRSVPETDILVNLGQGNLFNE